MIQKSAIMKFSKELVDRPLISRMIREFDVEVNILQASITPSETGKMFAIFKGENSHVNNAISYLKKSGVKVFLPEKNLIWDEEKCVHCTACAGQCPSAAFTVDESTRKISYIAERCIACELCIPACMYGTIEMVDDDLLLSGDEK